MSLTSTDTKTLNKTKGVEQWVIKERKEAKERRREGGREEGRKEDKTKTGSNLMLHTELTTVNY